MKKLPVTKKSGFGLMTAGLLVIAGAILFQKQVSHHQAPKPVATAAAKPGAIAITSTAIAPQSTITIDSQPSGANQPLAAGLHDVTITDPGHLPGRYQVTIASEKTLNLTNDQPKGAILGGVAQTTPDQISLDPVGANGRMSVVDGDKIRLVPIGPQSNSPTPQPSPTSTASPTPTGTETVSWTVVPPVLPETATIPIAVVHDNLLLAVAWNPKADQAILSSVTDQGTPEVAIYVLTDQAYEVVPDVREAIWQPGSDHLFTISVTGVDQLKLDERSADGKPVQTLPITLDKRSHSLTVSPKSDAFAWYYPTDDAGKTTVMLSYKDGNDWKTAQTTITQLADQTLRLSPDGRTVLFQEIRNKKRLLTSLDTSGKVIQTTIEPLDGFWQWAPDGKRIWALRSHGETTNLGVSSYTIEQWTLGNQRPRRAIAFTEPILWDVGSWLVSETGQSASLVVGPEVQTIVLEDQ